MTKRNDWAEMDLATRSLAQAIGGWLSDLEMVFLYDAARRCTGRGVIVEIGSYMGKSTVCLARGSQAGRGVKVYAIDPHRSNLEHRLWLEDKSSYPVFLDSITRAGVADLVVPMVTMSREAAATWSQPIELLWIDGDHTYEGAKADIELFGPYVLRGGTVAFHDATDGGDVGRVVQEAFRHARYARLKLVDSIMAAEVSVGAKGPRDRMILLLHREYRTIGRLRLLRTYKRVLKRLVAGL